MLISLLALIYRISPTTVFRFHSRFPFFFVAIPLVVYIRELYTKNCEKVIKSEMHLSS